MRRQAILLIFHYRVAITDLVKLAFTVLFLCSMIYTLFEGERGAHIMIQIEEYNVVKKASCRHRVNPRMQWKAWCQPKSTTGLWQG